MHRELKQTERIKWGYALARIPGLPETWDQACRRTSLDEVPTRLSDVMITEVLDIGRHTRIDSLSAVKSTIFPGDLLGVTFASRYATRQFEACIPRNLDELHLVCSGGVCGRVVGLPDHMRPPTRLRPIGYLRGGSGERVNLREYALGTVEHGAEPPAVVTVVGASMDSGKTTAAYSLVNGLTRAGHRVAAAKITGTASAKDLLLFKDAGATHVMDFTDIGFGSTADLAPELCAEIVETTLTNLSSGDPDCVVLEIADGITQRETGLMLEALVRRVSGVIYTCNDSLGVKAGVSRLRTLGLPVLAVSGTVTSSPLSTREAQLETDVPVLTRADLGSPAVGARLGLRLWSDTGRDLEASAVSDVSPARAHAPHAV